jgi:hypothetical protein
MENTQKDLKKKLAEAERKLAERRRKANRTDWAGNDPLDR